MNRFILLNIIFIILATISINAQTIIKSESGYGLTDPNGNIVIEPKLDSIYLSRKEFNLGSTGHKHFILVNNNKIGLAFYAVDTGMVILDIEYDEITAQATGFTILRKGDKYGYITYDPQSSSSNLFSSMAVIRYVTSVYISDIIYNYVGSKYGHGGYLILNGKYGLIQSYGASILPIYDTIPEHITRCYLPSG